MASLYTRFKNALGGLVGYAEIDLGLDTDGVPKRIPQSVPSDAMGVALFSSANPGLVTVSDGSGPLTVDGSVSVANLPALVAGKLPVDIGGESVTITGPVTISSEIEIKNDTGNPVPVASRTNAPRVSATGALAAVGNTVTLALDGMSTAVVQVSGTWAGTVAWSASVDGGATYFPVNLIPYAGGTAVASTTGNGQWEFACGGLTHLQAQMTAFTSGSASVLIAAANGAKSLRVGAPVGQPLPTREQAGVTPVQTYVAVPAFTSGNTAGAGGTNNTVALAATTTGSTAFLLIDNTGSADAEVWFGAIPADASVGQSPKRGKLLPAGAGLFFDVRIPVGPIYVTAPSATGLSVVTGA